MAIREPGCARLKQLEQCYVNRTEDAFSIETLLDALFCLYDECCSSTLRKEKNIAEFVDYGYYLNFFISSSRWYC